MRNHLQVFVHLFLMHLLHRLQVCIFGNLCRCCKYAFSHDTYWNLNMYTHHYKLNLMMREKNGLKCLPEVMHPLVPYIFLHHMYVWLSKSKIRVYPTACLAH